MGLGDFWLQSNNGKKISLDNLKELKKSDLKNNPELIKLFDIFNTNKSNGSEEVLDKQELNSLFNTFSKAAQSQKGKNTSIFETEEAEDFINSNSILQETNIKTSDLFDFLSKIVKPQNEQKTISEPSRKTKTNQEVKAGVIESLRSDSDETLKIISNMNNGDISDIYDSVKTFLDMDTSKAKVLEAAVNQAQGAKYMEKAQSGGLTREEYIKANKQRLQDMMKARLYKKDKNGIDYLDKNRADLKMSRKEFEALMLATIERMTDDMDIKSVKEKMRQLPMTTENGDRFLMDSIKQNAIVLFGKAKSAGCSTLDLATKYIYDTTKIVKPSPDDKKLLTFDEVFYYEQGVNYSKEDCEKYLDVQTQLTKNLSSYNKYLEFKTGADKILKEKDAEKALNDVIKLFEQFYSDPSYPNLAYKNLKSVVKNSNLPINVTQDETGRISISMVSGSEDLLLSYVSDILAAEGNVQQERLDKVFGGNAEEKLEELQKEVEQAHEKAYGNDFSSTLGKAMIEDNQTFIQRYTGNASMTGMGLTVVGGVLCFTPAAALGAAMITAGNTLAIGGMAAESGLGFYEASTRKNGAEDGEYEELTKTMLMNLGGFGFGGIAGKTGMKLFNKFVSKELDSLPKLSEAFKSAMVKGNRAEALKIVCSQPEYRKQFAKGLASKLLSDFSISYAGDLVMMGVLDTQDDWESLLQSNLIGILAGMGGDIKDAAHLGMKGDRYRTLQKKEQDGTITEKEMKELALLRQDADIRNLSGGNEGVNEGVNGRVDAESRKGVMQEERDVLHQKSMQDLQTELTLPDLFRACDKKFVEQETLKEGENIYTPEEKSQIQELYKKNSKVVAELLNLQANKNSYIYPENRFSPQMMQKMIEVSQKYPKLYEKLLKYDSNFEWMYRENIIQYFEQAYEKNSKLADELFDMKDSENEPRFFGENLLLVVQNIEKPQVRDFVYSKVLRNGKEEYAIESWQIRNYINKSLDDIEIKIMQLKTFDGKYNLFTSDEMGYAKSVLNHNPKCLNDIQNPKTSEKAKKELMIESHKIISNVLFEYPNLKDFLVNITPENTYSVDMNTKSSDGSFSFICYSNDIIITIRIKPNLNKGFDILSKESRRDDGNISHVWVEFADGRSQIEDIEYDTFKSEGKEFKVSKNLTKTLYDKYGEPIYQEKTIKTDNVLHAYNIEGTERANTPLKNIVKTNQTNNSETKITKEYTHLNGMKTISNIIQSERGIESSYRVVGRNGKTFIDTRRTHKKISENHCESSLNGQKYDIVLDVDKVVVSRLDKNGNKEETITLGSNILDPKLKELYKNLPGDYFFVLKKAGIKRVELFDGGSGVTPEGIVQISKDDLKNPFVLAHELGHVIDHALLNDLNNNHVLMQIFLKEFAKYQQSASYEEGKIIDYFTEIQDNAYEGVIGRKLSYLQEIIAETHALYSGLSNDNSIIGMRGIELQKHFPETMTFVMKKFNHVYSQVNSGTLKQTTYEADVSVRKGITRSNTINIDQAVPDKYSAQKAEAGKNVKTDATKKFMTPEERKVRISKLNNAKISSDAAMDIDALIFELGNVKKSNPQEHLKQVQNIQNKINALRITNPEEAKKLQQIFNAKVNNPKASEVTDDMVALAVEHLVRQYNVEKANITQFIESMGFNKFGHYECRVKSDTSLFDKISNYLKDHPDETFADAVNDVRDCYGGRFVIDIGKMMNEPEVAELVNQGKIGEARQLAAEKMKEELVKIFQTQAGKNPSMFYRVSNYVTKEGNGLFDESHLFNMRQAGLDCVVLSTDEEVISQGKKKSTKSQRSGYCAFQVNLTINGRSVELQFKTDEVDKISNNEHWIYDMVTGKDIVGRTEELDEFVSPLRTLVLDTMPKEVYDNYYTKYTSAWYNWAELKAEGKEVPPEPKLQDYAPEGTTFDPRLSMKNLNLFDEIAGRIKKGLPVEDGIKEYNERLSNDDALVSNLGKLKITESKNLKSELKKLSVPDDEINNIDVNNPVYKYINLENVELIKRLTGMTKINDIINCLANENINTIIEKYKLFKKSGINLDFVKLTEIETDSLNKINETQIQACNKLCNALGIDFDIDICALIENPENMTTELISSFKSGYQKLQQLGVKISINESPEMLLPKIQEMTKLLELLQQLSIEYNGKENTNVVRLGKYLKNILGNDYQNGMIEKLLQNNNIQQIQNLLNSKENGNQRFTVSDVFNFLQNGVLKYAEMTDENGAYRFNATELHKIAEIMDSENRELVQDLIYAKNHNTNSYKYSAHQIIDLYNSIITINDNKLANYIENRLMNDLGYSDIKEVITFCQKENKNKQLIFDCSNLRGNKKNIADITRLVTMDNISTDDINKILNLNKQYNQTLTIDSLFTLSRLGETETKHLLTETQNGRFNINQAVQLYTLNAQKAIYNTNLSYEQIIDIYTKHNDDLDTQYANMILNENTKSYNSKNVELVILMQDNNSTFKNAIEKNSKLVTDLLEIMEKYPNNQEIINENLLATSNVHLLLTTEQGKVHLVIDKNGKITVSNAEKGNIVTRQDGTTLEEGPLEVIKDANGRVVSRTLRKNSKRFPGQNIVMREIFDTNGNVIKVEDLSNTHALKENNIIKNGYSVDRNITSISGVKTKQRIIETPEQLYTKYEFGDFVLERTYKKFNPLTNTSETILNGNKFTAKFSDQKIVITRELTNGKTDTVVLEMGTDIMSDELLPLLKTVDVDQLYMVKKLGCKLNYDSIGDRANYSSSDNCITITPIFNSRGTFSHEFGHLMDYMCSDKIIFETSEFKDTYTKELEVFRQTTSYSTLKKVGYYTTYDYQGLDDNNWYGNTSEINAEGTAITTGENRSGSNILQENFSETIGLFQKRIYETIIAE